jgi:hypothetical protein
MRCPRAQARFLRGGSSRLPYCVEVRLQVSRLSTWTVVPLTWTQPRNEPEGGHLASVRRVPAQELDIDNGQSGVLIHRRGRQRRHSQGCVRTLSTLETQRSAKSSPAWQVGPRPAVRQPSSFRSA